MITRNRQLDEMREAFKDTNRNDVELVVLPGVRFIPKEGTTIEEVSERMFSSLVSNIPNEPDLEGLFRGFVRLAVEMYHSMIVMNAFIPEESSHVLIFDDKKFMGCITVDFTHDPVQGDFRFPI